MTRRAKVVAAVIVAAAVVAATVLLWPRPGPQPTASTPPAAPGTPTPIESEGDAAAPVAVFIGDSYTVGTATSLEGSGFPAILSERRGWQMVNLAIPGTGYSTNQPDGRCPNAGCSSYIGIIPDAVAHDPDIVVVSGGRNDLTRAYVDEAVDAFFTELRSQLPDARIIVTSPLWDDSPSPPFIADLRQTVEEAAAAIGAEHLDLGDLFLDRPELIASDDLHPNEQGLELIATRIDELLPADG
ncbi:SGNH/GDSL hydrolase family protein [Agrococcus sp. TF02-05]|uniref:SGNH/GDSL hydrolase family protein n=1 Tax=Agrococcus sp. TF02-05 TaxID=2815211 RepID=UPI001AA11A38|nr:SGNH/GDSL hydrolase family protein [Agrococcus sp. TF02-05]MBO1769480.1 SGNH/GDSL hydrolase family protein [Agrococcus sp. TF02-05]